MSVPLLPAGNFTVTVEVLPPEAEGGETAFANMLAAYDALDDATKRCIAGLHAVHRSWWEPVEESVHPVVRTHPETGRKALFVNGIFTKRIVELDESEKNPREIIRRTEHGTG